MTTTRLGQARLATWLAIALIVPYVLVLGGTLSFIALPEGRVIMHALIVGTGVIGILVATRRPEIIRSPVIAAGAVFIVVTVIAALGSLRPAASLEAVTLLVLSAPCYLAIRAVAWNETLSGRIRWLIVLSAFLVLIPYVIEVLAAWTDWWLAFGISLPPIRPGNPSGTVGSSNALATYTYLFVPYAVWACWSWRRHRLVASLLLGGAIFALVTSGSRGAWLGALAGIIVGSVMVAADRGGVLRRLSWRRLVLAIGIGLAVIAVTSPWIAARVAAGDAGRYEIWAAALSIFARFPLLGAGPGSWQGMRPTEPITLSDTASILTPHQSLLYVGAETGVVGLVAAILLVGSIVMVAWRAYRSGSHQRRLEAAVICGSLVGLAVHSLFDPQFMLAAVMLMTMYLVARLDPPPQPFAAPSEWRARWPVAVAGAAMAIAIVLVLRIDGAMLDGESGIAAIDRGDWAAALPAFERAAGTHDLGVYELGRAIALSRLGRPTEAAEALARQASSDALTAPSAGIAVLLESADPARAAAAADVVRRAGAYDPTASLNAAAVLDGRSDPAAVGVVADVVAAVPFLRLDLPRGSPISSETWAAGIELAIRRLESADPLAAADIALEAHDAARAATLAAGAPEGAERDLFELYLAARSGSPPDLVKAKDAVRAAPTERAITWYARLATMGGSETARSEAAVLDRLLFQGSPFDSQYIDTDGETTNSNVARVLSYPGAFHRIGPHRPYVTGMTTIASEPWSP